MIISHWSKAQIIAVLCKVAVDFPQLPQQSPLFSAQHVPSWENSLSYYQEQQDIQLTPPYLQELQMQYAERLQLEENRLVRMAREEQARREQRDLEMQVLSVIKKVSFSSGVTSCC